MKEHIFAMFGTPLNSEKLYAAVDADIQSSLAEGVLQTDEIDEARALWRKTMRHGMHMIIATDDHEQTDGLDPTRLLNKEWGATTEHRWLYPTLENEGELYFTHVVLLEGPKIEGIATDPFYFNGKIIEGPFQLVCFDERTGKYLNFHCPNCCVTIKAAIMGMQDAWRRQATGGEAKEATHAAPKRLQ